MAKTMTPMVVLKTFFGFREGQTLQDFHQEIKALSADEKKYLAELSAKELGVEIDWSKSV